MWWGTGWEGLGVGWVGGVVEGAFAVVGDGVVRLGCGVVVVLRGWIIRLGGFLRFVEEVESHIIVVIIAVFDGAEECRFLWVFGDLADLLVGQEGFAHACELALFLAPAGEELVV